MKSLKDHFARWDQKATVRRKNRLLLDYDEVDSGRWWTPELVPAADHPMVRDLGEGARHVLELEQLFRFHVFTEKLEHEAVNPVALDIAYRRLPALAIDKEMREEAFNLYADEAAHAQHSADLINQVEHATGVSCDDGYHPQFLDRLSSIKESVTPEIRPFVDMLFVVVSETLITHTFSDLPHDQRVVTIVRENIRNHYEDEGRHCAYFRTFFAKAWPQLCRDHQRVLGRMLPSLILSFCETDYASISRSLGKVGLSDADIDAIIRDCYSVQKVAESAKRSAVVSLQLFRSCGVLDDAETHDAFGSAGLI